MNRSSPFSSSFSRWIFLSTVIVATIAAPALLVAGDGPACHGKAAAQGAVAADSATGQGGGHGGHGAGGGCCGKTEGAGAGGCCGKTEASTGGCCGQAEGAGGGCCGQAEAAGCCGQGQAGCGGCGKAAGAERAGCCGGGGQGAAGEMAGKGCGGHGMGPGAGAMAGKMAGPGSAADPDQPSVRGCRVDGQCAMRTAMGLVHQRHGIERTVEDIPGGVRTVTTAADAQLAEQIERHVREVSALLEGGGQMRMWDPLFATIFEHRDRIELRYEPTENGVVVIETSDDPWITEVIRAHARKVDDFLARGPAAVHEPTAVPPRPGADRNDREAGREEGSP